MQKFCELSGLRRSSLIPRAHVRKSVRLLILIILQFGMWIQVDPWGLTSQPDLACVCIIKGTHAHAFTHPERERQINRDRQ